MRLKHGDIQEYAIYFLILKTTKIYIHRKSQKGPPERHVIVILIFNNLLGMLPRRRESIFCAMLLG